VDSEARNADQETLLQSGIFYQTRLAKPELERDRFGHCRNNKFSNRAITCAGTLLPSLEPALLQLIRPHLIQANAPPRDALCQPLPFRELAANFNNAIDVFRDRCLAANGKTGQ
jgi:hypothetical protein